MMTSSQHQQAAAAAAAAPSRAWPAHVHTNHKRHSRRSSSHYSHSEEEQHHYSAVLQPQPPPLPQRQPPAQPRPGSDLSYWSEGSGSTRLPTFPEDEDDYDGDDVDYTDDAYSVIGRRRQKHRHQRRTVAPVPQPSQACCCHGNQVKAAQAQARRAPIATAVVYPISSYPSAGGGSLLPAVLPAAVASSPSSPSSYGPGGGGGHGGVGRGCGGRCETCENVCYYLLQVAFAMGVLIGASLCIAGAALRKSPGRQLQVLLYIGALVALVSALLLVVQCRARRAQRQRPPIALVPPKAQPAHTALTTIQRGTAVTLLQPTCSTSGDSNAVWWRKQEP